MKKRDFIKAGLISIAGLASLKIDAKSLARNAYGVPFSRPKFSYDAQRIRNIFSQESFNKYYEQVVNLNDRLNKGLKHTTFAPANVKQVLLRPTQFKSSTLNIAAVYYNQKMFLNQFSGKETNAGNLYIYQKVCSVFNSTEELSRKLVALSENQPVDTWLWVVLQNNELQIFSSHKHQTPLNTDSRVNQRIFPLIGVDLNDQVYTDKFGSNKQAYIDSVIHNLNWTYINNRYHRALKNA